MIKTKPSRAGNPYDDVPVNERLRDHATYMRTPGRFIMPNVTAALCEEAADELETAKKPVGRPPSGKIMVNLRLDPDIVARFKAMGPGWQAKINDALAKIST